MEASTTPDRYEASTNETGEYVDKLPNLTNGIICDCINRKKSTVIYTRAQFNTHIKSQSHTNYLIMLNNNKNNYYSECIKLRDEIKILKQQLTHAHITIDVLTLRNKETVKEQPTLDLLGMNDIDF